MTNMIYLISEETLKSEGLCDDNLYGGLLSPAIRLAQDKDLQTVIGTNLYNKICDLVYDGTISTTTNAKYKSLLDDYIIPYLMWQTLAEVAVPISWKFKNEGLTESSPDYVTRPSMKDFQYVVQKYENAATFYGKRLSDYLKAHCTDYPEFITHINGEFYPDDKDFRVGLYLGKGHSHRCCLRNDLPDSNK